MRWLSVFKQKNKGQKGLNDPSVLWINYLAVLSTMGCCLSLEKYSCFLWSNKTCLKKYSCFYLLFTCWKFCWTFCCTFCWTFCLLFHWTFFWKFLVVYSHSMYLKVYCWLEKYPTIMGLLVIQIDFGTDGDNGGECQRIKSDHSWRKMDWNWTSSQLELSF